MKWFGVDSDTPNDPKIRALLLQFGRRSNKDIQARMGGLFLVWCHIADHGAEPGRAVAADGSPLPLEEIADAAFFDSVEALRDLLDFCAAKKHIDPVAWRDGIVFFPAMAKRADEYTKKVLRRAAAKSGRSPAPVPPVSGDVRSSPDTPIGTVGPVGVVRSSSDHIVTTEERERPRARTGSGVMAGALPRDHVRHAFCGRVCVPDPLHGALKKQLGGDEEVADRTLRDFYASTLAAIPDAQPIGDEPFTFWRKHFAATFPSAAPTTGPRTPRAPSHTPAAVDKYAGIGVRDDDVD